MSRRTIVLVIGIALLLALAGCQTSDNGPVTGTTEANVTPTPANLDESEVTERHVGALEAAGSFNASKEVRVEANGTNVSALFSTFAVETSYAVDYENDRALRRTTVVGSITKYTEGEETYERRALGFNDSRENVTYRYADGADDSGPNPVDREAASGLASMMIGEVSYTDLGKTSYRGQTVTRYEAHDVDAISGLSSLPDTRADANFSSNVTLESFDAIILVDQKGIVRYSEWSVTVAGRNDSTITLSVVHEVTEVGSADVPRPDWLSNARKNAAGLIARNRCGTPSVSGKFSQTSAGEGVRNVTYAVDGMANASAVTVGYEDATSDTVARRSALFEGDRAIATGVEPGTTVRVFARNDCGEQTTVETYTVY